MYVYLYIYIYIYIKGEYIYIHMYLCMSNVCMYLTEFTYSAFHNTLFYVLKFYP